MGDRRDQRRWQRELEEQLRALPTYEGDDVPDAGHVAPVERSLPRPPRRRRRARRDDRLGQPYGPDDLDRLERGAAGRRTTGGRVGPERRRTFVTVGLTVAVVVAVVGAGLTPLADQVRGLLGIGDRGSSSTYQFLSTDPLSGQPYRWSSCDPIRYVVNPSQAPDGWEDTLSESLAEVSAASGLEFESEGRSDDGPSDSRFGSGDRPKPVLVSWVTPEEEPELAGSIVGVAGPASVGDQYVTGTVLLDAPAFADMEERGDEGLQRAVVMHELAHLVGLDHVDDDRQLMYPSTTFQTSFGNGDLEGLAILGEGPCR